jgi:hypothetical protein
MDRDAERGKGGTRLRRTLRSVAEVARVKECGANEQRAAATMFAALSGQSGSVTTAS